MRQSVAIDCLVGELYDIAAFMQLARQFTDMIQGSAPFHRFGVKTDADAHCQVGNSAEFAANAFDWLDETFA